MRYQPEQEASVRIQTRDLSTPPPQEQLPVVIVLDRLRSAFNTGNIFRLAETVQAERIVACGYTPAPPHPKLAKTARGCDERVPCSRMDTAAAAIRTLKQDGYTLYGVETVPAGPPVWNIRFRFPAAIVLGNEALGIAPEALDLCDACLQLPCRGVKNSINVANCAAVVLYAALQQWLEGQCERTPS